MLGVSRSKRDITYCKEAEETFKGRNVPGPGQYSHEMTQIKYGNKNHFSIPKASRESPDRNMHQRKICHQDAQQEIRIRKITSPKATIGQSKNKFDVTKMQSINQYMWKKGLIYH